MACKRVNLAAVRSKKRDSMVKKCCNLESCRVAIPMSRPLESSQWKASYSHSTPEWSTCAGNRYCTVLRLFACILVWVVFLHPSLAEGVVKFVKMSSNLSFHTRNLRICFDKYPSSDSKHCRFNLS